MKNLHSAAQAAAVALGKVLVMLECAVLAGLLICAQPVEEAQAQWAAPPHCVTFGKGTGTGLGYTCPLSAGSLLTGIDDTTDPVFSNIIRGQNYGAAMTNTGEAYGYSFRNSTTTGADIYTPINGGSAVNLQDGIQVVNSIPSTATIAHSGTVAAYFKNSATSTVNAVGFFTAGMCTTTNSACWGLNTLLMDNATYATHARTGQILIGIEADFNNTGAATQLIGMSVGGNGLAQSTNAIGYIVNSLSGLSAGTYRWTTGFACLNATVVAGNDCLTIGAQQASGTNVDSLYLSLQYFNAGGVQKHFQVLGTSGSSGQGAMRVVSNDTTSTLEVGTSGSAGRLYLAGSTSGYGILTPQATTSALLTMPNATGTLVATATAPLSINSTTGNLSWTGLTQYGVIYATATTGVGSTAAAGSVNQVLHGNPSGAPTWSAVVSADLNITTTSCTNQFVTAISSGGVGTCTTDTLASAQHANQGTTTTFLKGNASGNPSWSQVAISTDVSGLASGMATFLGSATSANLAATLTDETGSSGGGVAVFSISPTFTGDAGIGNVFTGTSNNVGQTLFQLNNTSSGSHSWQFAVAGSGQTNPGCFYFYDSTATAYRFSISSTGQVNLCGTNVCQTSAWLRIDSAGTTSVAPMVFTAGTNLTTAVAGGVEYDGNALYTTPVASNRGVSPSLHFCSLTADYTLTDNNSAQKAFNCSTNGTITLPGSTTYEFESVIFLTNTGTTSHTWAFLFGGTATITSCGYSLNAYTATSNALTADSAIYVSSTTSATCVAGAVVTAASTSATENVRIVVKGYIRVNATGTLIPQVKASAQPNGTEKVLTGSYFRMWPLGTNSVTTVGNWSWLLDKANDNRPMFVDIAA